MFDIEVSEEAAEDLQWFRKRDQVVICDGMDEALRYEPDTKPKTTAARACFRMGIANRHLSRFLRC